MALGKKIRELRTARGKSLQEVARAIGISKTHIWDLETGRSVNPSIYLVRNLANFFQIGIADLMEENPNAPEEDSSLVAIYRNLKALSKNNRETIRVLIERFLTTEREMRND